MTFSDIYTLNEQYVIRFDTLTREKVEITEGLEFKLDTRFNRQHHAAEQGEVLAAPEGDNIHVGDTVVCQYLVVEEKNKLGEDSEGFYQLSHREQIFCVLRMDEIIMIDGYILVKPEETEENEYEENEFGFKVPKAEVKGRETIAVVTHIGNDVTNVEVGDRVKIHKAAQYPLTLNGEKYYRVRSNVGLIWKYKKT
jgi:hypothetical protein